MTTAADHRDVEDAYEASLAGRSVPEEEAGLASFVGAVRATATRPGRPNAALAELLASGRLTDQPSPSTRTAQSAGSPPPRGAARNRNRRRITMILPALLAKILSAGAVAQAATGAGVALVVVTGAGAVGVLPDPLQDTVAAAVETVTPFDLPEADETDPVEDPVVQEPLPDEAVTDEVVDEAPAGDAPFDAATWSEEGPEAYPSFGAWVSAGAQHDVADALGVRFGELVSARARAKGMDAGDLEAEGVDVEALEIDDVEPIAPADPTAAPAPAVAPRSPATAPSAATQRGGDRGTSGKPAGGNSNGGGNGNGNGQGNGQGNGRD